MRVLVGSKNPVKIESVMEAFSKYFNDVEVSGVDVGSKVSSQPMNSETYMGAGNRALELVRVARESGIDADYFVGIEGGISEIYSRWFAFGAVCIIDRKGRIGYGASPHFELPASVTKELLDGSELGELTDKITGENNTKQKGGAIGFFTRGVMNRKDLYVHGLVVALVPFLNEKLFFE